MMGNLFQKTNFTSHAGLSLNYKIDCDSLRQEFELNNTFSDSITI